MIVTSHVSQQGKQPIHEEHLFFLNDETFDQARFL